MQRTLDDFLAEHRVGGKLESTVADAVAAISVASVALQSEIVKGSTWRSKTGADVNAGGDIQQELDVIADRLYLAAARKCGLAAYASEEQSEPVILDPNGLVAV